MKQNRLFLTEINQQQQYLNILYDVPKPVFPVFL